MGEEFAEVGGPWVVGASHGGGPSDHPIGAMLGGGVGDLITLRRSFVPREVGFPYQQLRGLPSVGPVWQHMDDWRMRIDMVVRHGLATSAVVS